MRLFIAIEIPEEVKEYIVKIQKDIDNTANKIRFADKNQIHLTLKFLGEVQPDKADVIKEELKRISFNPFSVQLDKIGVFPDEGYIRVIWVGLKPEEPILELQKDIDEALEKSFKKEKNFKAHITLARVKYIEDKENFINKLKNIEIENKKIEVNNFKLVKSTLTPEGPVYENLMVFG
ncbi:RNA 2',3'-cyclic phosphodiesterase [Candidatus Woesearchaeota archaeon]|jgi:2'-5' RNA ligase|nr:RNA 2',3'-cyclic phosphodiesterase [Candidatus Woesearchaeota archaeon]|tara:strand:- start:487 stop:1020 length:534 start_codon:yes stop_codon:yes gene_type:complete